MPADSDFSRAGSGAPVPDTGIFRLLADYALACGTTLQDPAVLERVRNALIPQLEAVAANPIVMYGVHTEAMFEWLVGALGGCELIQPLDGQRQALVNGERIPAPDYLVVTSTGQSLVVEVKNCAAKTDRWKSKRDYLTRIKRYSEASGAKPFVAIFWARRAMWTLLDVDFLLARSDAQNVSISFLDAFADSEMYLLGDSLVNLNGHPFRVRLDFAVQSEAPTDAGMVELELTVQGIELSLGGRPVTAVQDQQVLWYLAMHGFNLEGGNDFVRDSATKAHVEFTTDPGSVNDGLLSVDFISSILSKNYRAMSCDDGGRIETLVGADVDDGHVARLLASGFQGEEIGFVYLTIHPRRECTQSTNDVADFKSEVQHRC